MLVNNQDDYHPSIAVQPVVDVEDCSPAEWTTPMAGLTGDILLLGCCPGHTHGQT
jgi:hypothetical protein